MQTFSSVSRATVQLLATAAIALVSAATMASESAEFPIGQSLKTRAEVIAEMALPNETGFVQVGEASVFIDTATTTQHSRAEVRAEALQAARDHHFEMIYVGG